MQFDDWQAAQDYFFADGLTDGLPVVPPTPERVEAMLNYAGISADHELATEVIRQKRFTAGKAAVNAVMAGCLPEHFPVVLASITAIAERTFNLHASSTSTYGATVLTMVSGPYAETIGMNAGVEMMGNGNRANAAIGRAVNLFKANFYGSVPIVMDNSTFGHPGKIGFCFPENLAVSPWPSLAAEKGFGDDATIVTAYATLAPLQVTLHGDRDPAGFLTPVAHAMLAYGPNSTEVICVISPEAMLHIAEAGWSRRRVAEFLHENTHLPGVRVESLATFGTRGKFRSTHPGGRGRRPHHSVAGRRDGRSLRQPDQYLGQQPFRYPAGCRAKNLALRYVDPYPDRIPRRLLIAGAQHHRPN